MCGKVLGEEIVRFARRRQNAAACVGKSAGQRLLKVYDKLARRREHLFASLLKGSAPLQWAHYPADDAIDRQHGYQWFYHSHSPADRRDEAEHGHIHLFAGRKSWANRQRSKAEREFSAQFPDYNFNASTRHLIGIGFDAKGLPINLFTVNSWVTGDSLLTGVNTALLLQYMSLHTGHSAVDLVIESVVGLYLDEIAHLLVKRDRALLKSRAAQVLSNRRLEVLSTVEISIDAKLASIR